MLDGKLSESAEPMSARSGELLETGEESCALMEPRAEVRLGVRFMVKCFYCDDEADGCEKGLREERLRGGLREVEPAQRMPAPHSLGYFHPPCPQLPSLVTKEP